MKVLQIGSVLETNSEGYLVSQSHITKIELPWLDAVNNLKKMYLKHFKNNLCSVYVRGSVARGMALESISDIDTVTVLFNPPEKLDYKWAENTRNILEKEYSFATEIAHDFILYEDVMGSWENNGISFNYAFTIKTQCAFIYGQDFSDSLPQFKPNKHTAIRLLTDLNVVFERAQHGMLCHQKPVEILGWCRWVMKAIIRNSFLLVMEKENVFTRDLFPCCHLFLKHFPQQEFYIYQALEYAINPIFDIKKIILFLENFGSWLKDEIDEEFLG